MRIPLVLLCVLATLATAVPAVSAASDFGSAVTFGRDVTQPFAVPSGGFLPDGTFRLVGTVQEGDVTVYERRPMRASATPIAVATQFGDAAAKTSSVVDYAQDPAGRAVVVWVVTTMTDSHSALLLASRDAGAAAWSAPVRLAETSGTITRPHVAITSTGRVAAGWTVQASPTFETWVSVGTFGGAMGAPTKLSDAGSWYDGLSALEVRPGGDVFAVHTTDAMLGFSRRKVYVSRLAAGGSSWLPSVRADSEDPDADGEYADSTLTLSLAFADDGRGALVWGTQGDASRRVVKHRAIGEDGLVAPALGILNPTGHAQYPAAMFGDDGVLHVAWVGSATGAAGTHQAMLYQAAPGETPAVTALAPQLGQGMGQPVLAQASVGGRTVVAWRQQRAGSADPARVYAAVREPGAASFGAAQPLSGEVDPYELAAFADEFDVVVSWLDVDEVVGRVVDDTPPAIESLAVPPTVVTGQAVTFTVEASDVWSPVADSDISWEVGGTLVGSGRTLANRSFTTPGTYEVEVIAADAVGNARSAVRTVVVTAAPGGSTGGDGTGGTGDTGGGQEPAVEQPTPFVLTDTTSRGRVPNVVGLKAGVARDRFDRAGIDVDFDIRIVQRATAPRGITIGEVMTQAPRAGTTVQSGIHDRVPARLDVYGGPVVGKPTATGCAVTKVAAAVKGLELDLAKLVLTAMKCPYQVDVRPVASGDDAAVVGAATKKGKLTLAVNVPRKPTNNDVLLTFRENPNGISFASGDWTLTAGQKNAFTFQATPKALVGGKIPLLQKAIVTIDTSGIGGARNLTGQTDARGEKVTVLEPLRAGYVDILVEFPAGNDVSLWGTARLKVVDRSKAKVGTRLATVSGRVFEKRRSGDWAHVPGASIGNTGARRARFLDLSGVLEWMRQAVAGLGGAIGSAFDGKGRTSEQVLASALATAKVSPSQMLISDSLVSGRTRPVELVNAKVVSAGGGNVVSGGGANVVSPGGANVVSGGGANLIATGEAKVVSAGGANGLAASAPGLIAMGPAGVVSAGGNNVVSAGGANVVSAGGLNLLSDNGPG